MTLFKNQVNPRENSFKRVLYLLLAINGGIDLNHKRYVNLQIIISESILVTCCDKHIGL